MALTRFAKRAKNLPRWRRAMQARNITTAALVCLWLLATAWLTAPAMRSWREARRQVAVEKANVRAERTRLKNLRELASTHDTILSDIEYIEPTPARKLYVSTFVQQMDELAKNNSLALMGVTPDVPADSTGVPRWDGQAALGLTVMLRGPFNGFCALVGALQQFPKAVAIVSVSVRVDKNTTDGSVYGELHLLAQEIVGVRDMSVMTTPPTTPTSTMDKFDKDNLPALFNGELNDATGVGAGNVPAPAMSPDGAGAPGTAAPTTPDAAGAVPGAPATGPAAATPDNPPLGSPAATPKGAGAGSAEDAPPAAPPMAAGPDANGAAVAPAPNEPSLTDTPKPGNGPDAGKAAPAPSKQGALPAKMQPARVAARSGVNRRVWGSLKSTGLMPGAEPTKHERLAMDAKSGKSNAQ